ncbi:MAG TPA: hypothetical protein VJN22_05710 [Candidatus Eremiobacteraceae bacterium]|nr:hypothetical protein [Candidatus Eremiobacteraceae bacterium]
MTKRPEDLQQDWVNAHLGRSSKQTVERLLTSPQPRPPDNAAVLSLRGVKARCVAGGASNFWIVGHEAAEPVLSGDFPLTGMSPTAYFIQAPNFNYLPYAVPRSRLTPVNHTISGDVSTLEAQMRGVYG